MKRTLTVLGVAALASAPLDAQAPTATERLNPLIELHERGLPVFGLYTPSGRDGATTAERAEQTLGYAHTDYLFDGSMERGVDRGLPGFAEYVAAMRSAGATARTHPLVVKAPKITGQSMATTEIGRQLNAGATGIVLVGVESAEEVRQGLRAMRFRDDGGTRDEAVGDAPAYWGLTQQEYRKRADVWPLDPTGELVNWTIVESRKGLENVREIAAVEGVGVLFPGAGTLRGIFSERGPSGERVLDERAWEAAIQAVLAACKEFEVPCGYPANENDVEERLRQGFSVFVIGWGEGGFRTIETGRRLSGR